MESGEEVPVFRLNMVNMVSIQGFLNLLIVSISSC